MSEYFEVGAADEEIDESILSGKYVFHSFAASQWLPLVQTSAIGLNTESDINHLGNRIREFISERENFSYDGASVGDAASVEFEKFELHFPEVYKKLYLAQKFWHADQEKSLNEGEKILPRIEVAPQSILISDSGQASYGLTKILSQYRLHATVYISDLNP